MKCITGVALPLTSLSLQSREDGNSYRDADVPLVKLVLVSAFLKCSEPRDHILGLLGMTQWTVLRKKLPPMIRPNYTDPLRTCMRNATVVMIEEVKSLLPLAALTWPARRNPQGEDHDWPSWVPSWDDLDEFSSISFNSESKFTADDDHKLDINTLTTAECPDILFLRGYAVDTIDMTFPVLDPIEPSIREMRMTIFDVWEQVNR